MVAPHSREAVHLESALSCAAMVLSRCPHHSREITITITSTDELAATFLRRQWYRSGLLSTIKKPVRVSDFASL